MIIIIYCNDDSDVFSLHPLALAAKLHSTTEHLLLLCASELMQPLWVKV